MITLGNRLARGALFILKYWWKSVLVLDSATSSTAQLWVAIIIQCALYTFSTVHIFTQVLSLLFP
jgi:hypothetical protein